MRIHLIVSALILLAGASVGQNAGPKTYDPDLEGYVTRVTSSTAFDVNGVHVSMDDKTQFYFSNKNNLTAIPRKELKLYVGRPAQVYGKLRKKEHAIAATQLYLLPQKRDEISGSGVIDGIPPTGAEGLPENHMIRADGYVVLITNRTALKFQPPLNTDSAFKVNAWVKFRGKQRDDGVVEAQSAEFGENAISEDDKQLQARSEHDPSKVDPNAHQSPASMFFRGVDSKQIPPYEDDAMQARVSAIGAKLVPKYQLDLPDTNPSKINFRFQVVDNEKWHDAGTWPNGLILVPYQVVERMQNDSQLATVLADNIACALEKQTFRALPEVHAMRAVYWAGLAGGLFVPGLGAATTLTSVAGSETIMRRAREQSGRVSLSLLRDAGYDINEAPVAWWLLAPRKPKAIEDTPMPDRSAYLYKILGENWHRD